MFPRDLTRLERLRESLQRDRAERPEAEAAPRPDERPDKVGGENLAPFGAVAQPFGDHDGRAEIVALILDWLADVETNPDLEPIVDLARVVPLHRLLDPYRAAQGIDHAGERDHQPVAEVLDLLAGVRCRDVPQQAEVNPPESLGLIVAERVEQRGGADEVGEQQRHDRAGRPGRAGVRDPGGSLGGLVGYRERRRSVIALAAAAQRLGQLTRRLRRRDPQLVAQSLGQALIRPDRTGAVPTGGEPPHQHSLRLLCERIQRDPPARVADRCRQVPSRFNAVGEAAKHAGQAIPVLVAPLVDPVVVEPGQYVAPAKLDSVAEPVLIDAALKFGDVGPHEILAG